MSTTSTTPAATSTDLARTPARSARTLLIAGTLAGPLFAVLATGQVLLRDGFDLRRHPQPARNWWSRLCSNSQLRTRRHWSAVSGCRRPAHHHRGCGPTLVGPADRRVRSRAHRFGCVRHGPREWIPDRYARRTGAGDVLARHRPHRCGDGGLHWAGRGLHRVGRSDGPSPCRLGGNAECVCRAGLLGTGESGVGERPTRRHRPGCLHLDDCGGSVAEAIILGSLT
jgi:hypothetical protein